MNISSWAAQKYIGNVIYGVSKAATDKMTRGHGARVEAARRRGRVSLYPGLVRTELVMQAAAASIFPTARAPSSAARVIAALAKDPALMDRTGKVLVAAGWRANSASSISMDERPRR